MTAEQKAAEALEIAERVQGWGRDHYAQIGLLQIRLAEAGKQVEQALAQVQSKLVELDLQKAQLEAQKQEVRRGMVDIATMQANLKGWVEDVAWAKAGDRIEAWYKGMASYADPRLLNLIYNRVLKHVHTLGLKDTSQLKKAEPQV